MKTWRRKSERSSIRRLSVIVDIHRWNRKNIKHQVKRTQTSSYTRRHQKWYSGTCKHTSSTYHPMGQCTDHGQREYLVQEKSQRSTKNTRRKTNNEPRQWLKSQPHLVPNTTITAHHYIIISSLYDIIVHDCVIFTEGGPCVRNILRNLFQKLRNNARTIASVMFNIPETCDIIYEVHG